MTSPLLKSTLGHRDQPKVARIKRHCFTKDIVEKLKLFIRLNPFFCLPSRLRLAEKLGQPYKSVKNFMKDWRNYEFPLPMEFSSVDCFASLFEDMRKRHKVYGCLCQRCRANTLRGIEVYRLGGHKAFIRFYCNLMLEMPDSEGEIPPDVPEVTGHVPKKGADCAPHLTPSAPMPEVLAQDETFPGTPLHLTPSAPMPKVLPQDETFPGIPPLLLPLWTLSQSRRVKPFLDIALKLLLQEPLILSSLSIL